MTRHPPDIALATRMAASTADSPGRCTDVEGGVRVSKAAAGALRLRDRWQAETLARAAGIGLGDTYSSCSSEPCSGNRPANLLCRPLLPILSFKTPASVSSFERVGEEMIAVDGLAIGEVAVAEGRPAQLFRQDEFVFYDIGIA